MRITNGKVHYIQIHLITPNCAPIHTIHTIMSFYEHENWTYKLPIIGTDFHDSEFRIRSRGIARGVSLMNTKFPSNFVWIWLFLFLWVIWVQPKFVDDSGKLWIPRKFINQQELTDANMKIPFATLSFTTIFHTFFLSFFLSYLFSIFCFCFKYRFVFI